LTEKPVIYGQIGVQEYYAYDPYEPPLPLSRRKGRRLFGWQRDARTGLLRQLSSQPDGSLWSPHLNSWLRSDGRYLRLYDRSGSQRLTKTEAETERAEREARARQAEAERAEAAIQQLQAEAEREALHAQEATRRAEALAEKLRALGVDPD
jgi:hypothetical protein